MQKKLMSWKTKGMNQDLSVSAFNSEFSFENMNLRLSTNEGNTLMSWVNEKGTKELTLAIDNEPWKDDDKVLHPIIDGYPIGTAIIEHQLVLFTTSRISEDTTIPEGAKPDNIYVLTYDAENDLIKGKRLYHGNLGFDVQHPLETLAFFESQYIQKIYWTDGKNQPRIINICADSDKLEKWNHADTNTVHTGQDYYFDFIPSFGFKETVNITKNNTAGGTFAPGVIQYCLTYINKYGQQSNVFYQSPLYYLSPSDRGASPEEKVGCSFTITIKGADKDFDYVRLYSIQRTSVDGEVIAKLLEDIAIDSAINDTLTYTDSGTTGTSIDSTELLYVGGAEVVAGTLADKDNTLFLGNIEQKNIVVSDIQDYFDYLRKNSGERPGEDDEDKKKHWPAFKYDGNGESVKTLQADTSNGFYAHTQQLDRSQREITTFKGGDYYRLGFQLQKRTGEWTEPIFIDDVENNNYPQTGVYSDVIKLAYASCKIDIADIKTHLGNNLDFSVFKRIRPMVVYPDLSDRNVVCQGVINPTVFNYEDRYFNSPFAQPSWFFRPYMFNEQEADTSIPEYTSSEIGRVSSSRPDLDEGQARNPDINESLFVDKYVMVEWIQTGYLLTVLSNKTLHYTIEGTPFDDNFDYAVVLVRDLLNARVEVAFFRSALWQNVNPHTEGIPGGACLLSDKKWRLYSELHNDDGLAYYQKINEGVPKYYLDFYTKITVNGVDTYTPFYITFTDAQIIGFEKRKSFGAPLRFSHYESLFTRSEYVSPADIYSPEMIEIQGAVNSVTSPVEGDPPSAVLDKNNTQFFIDQSIVTLNSPDLEFDQALQASGTDGMMLRIIGAIPITANNSWHDIQTEGTMGVNASFRSGSGEHNWTSSYKNIDEYAGNRLVSKYLWNDVIWYNNGGTPMFGPITDFLISPWQTSGHLNNNGSATLKFKRESNLLYSLGTEYLAKFVDFENISTKLHLTENAEVMSIKLPKQAAESTDINYYGNIDKVLYNANGFSPLFKPVDGLIPEGFTESTVYRTLSMKYKSTTHAVIAVNEDKDEDSEDLRIHVMPRAYNPGALTPDKKYVGTLNVVEGTAYWGDSVKFSQVDINVSGLFVDGNNTHHDFNLLWLGELYKEPKNRFGGQGRSAIRSNNWLIGGEAVNLYDETNQSLDEVTLNWTDGDTYYQRYDCLKTYPYTYEDPNQLVEILSFMCETHVNIDGRYDRNRGQVDNTLMSPQNFNQYNTAYSQRNNYFTYRKLDTENSRLYYPNQVYYSKTKTSGADVDLYTNVTLASIHELDGSKGKVNALRKWNNQLLAFQDSGISQIMFNENTLLSTERGVPVEIANSGKIQGNHYISDTIGCSNKWSIVSTPSGIYFMDSNDKSIYRFSGQLQNISATQGFNTWCKTHIPNSSLLWNPKDFDNIVGYYDRLNQDILFINSDYALAYSEKLGCFTSFYNYGGIPYFCNLDDMGIWLNYSTYPEEEEDEEHEPHLIDYVKTNVWQHQGGEYCRFFNEYKPYWMTLVGNHEPQMDKIFTNMEFRACVDGEGETVDNRYQPYLPFDTLETWNEYQHGIANLKNLRGHQAYQHDIGQGIASLKRKFRMWRCDIPRNNLSQTHKTDRMRNPWLYLKLTKQDSTNKRTEIHDLMMTYYS